ncbi:major royal jelly protein 5 [Schistocerca americana]|uniref:major royal jelly protein 5 n=1 Tax=Schistocerca americana TaxID=7009 RepID=UPI001F4F45BA|nr:major royal jelly protein 5 [Schistocerca americana]XP_047105426.1 major royal jelly protein 5 [Schistocerca piceifrons]XP_049948360.1 major royal jelly protein 5 [Schistocerca serialis cubense]
MKLLLVVVAACVAAAAGNPTSEATKPVVWTGGEFNWPCSSTKKIFQQTGRYISKNVIATRTAIYKDDAILALPRFKQGIPVTLARVSLKSRGSQAVLDPFPCWSLQEEGNCKALQSVVDLFLDAQDILWVLDVGIVNTLETPVRRCPPKIVAINVKTGKVVKVIDLSGLVCSASRLQYLVVDYSADGRCFVYVSDAATRAILVYDVTGSRGYRVVLPKAVSHGCARRDVLYLALVRKPCGTTILFFTYLSSSRLFAIKTEYLRRGSASGRVQDVGVKPGKLVILGTDNGRAIFFRFEAQSEIYRWDSDTAFKRENLVLVYRSGTCELATHVAADYKRGRMRVLESNFPDYVQGTVGCGPNHALSLMQGCH